MEPSEEVRAYMSGLAKRRKTKTGFVKGDERARIAGRKGALARWSQRNGKTPKQPS